MTVTGPPAGVLMCDRRGRRISTHRAVIRSPAQGGACRKSQALPARVTSGAGLSSVCLAVAATHTWWRGEAALPSPFSAWGSGGQGAGRAGAPGAGPLGGKPLLESGGCALCAGCVLGSSCQGRVFHPGPASSLGMGAPDVRALL